VIDIAAKTVCPFEPAKLRSALGPPVELAESRHALLGSWHPNEIVKPAGGPAPPRQLGTGDRGRALIMESWSSLTRLGAPQCELDHIYDVTNVKLSKQKNNQGDQRKAAHEYNPVPRIEAEKSPLCRDTQVPIPPHVRSSSSQRRFSAGPAQTVQSAADH
jgi:hypothetical protein